MKHTPKKKRPSNEDCDRVIAALAQIEEATLQCKTVRALQRKVRDILTEAYTDVKYLDDTTRLVARYCLQKKKRECAK